MTRRIIISLLALSLVGTGLASSIWAMGSPSILLTPTPAPSTETTPAPPAGTIAEDWKGVEMIYAPTGTFEMGASVEVVSDVCIEIFHLSEDEDPLDCLISRDDSSLSSYQATLRGFWIDRYEVTNEQYQQCVEHGRCELIPDLPLQVINDPQNPIVGVTWYSAMMFCNWRGARLPTEEEWEYAASGPDNNVLPSGSTRILDHISSTLEAHPVGSFSGDVSWVGVYDMAHNVSEWTESRFVPYPSFEGIWRFPAQSDVDRVVRGGSFDGGAELMFTFVRQHTFPERETSIIGFRCARSSDPRE